VHGASLHVHAEVLHVHAASLHPHAEVLHVHAASLQLHAEVLHVYAASLHLHAEVLHVYAASLLHAEVLHVPPTLENEHPILWLGHADARQVSDLPAKRFISPQQVSDLLLRS